MPRKMREKEELKIGATKKNRIQKNLSLLHNNDIYKKTIPMHPYMEYWFIENNGK